MRSYQGARVARLLAATALTGISALVGASPAWAQQAPAEVDEVIVTASRRAQDVTQIPYNITAVSGASVERAGVASIEDLSRQVPNLVVTSSGNQFLGAQRQIMRGLNASASNRNGVALEQNPVSTYLGNAPYPTFSK